MNMKIESRTKRVESAKSVARGMDLIIKTLTDARNEGQKLIEEAERKADAMVSEAQQQREEVLSRLTDEKEELEIAVEALRGFESRYRSKLLQHLDAQVQELKNLKSIEASA